ncbi:MAG: hypothetical protein AAF202_06370 [Pseudomonadota bacterium]
MFQFGRLRTVTVALFVIFSVALTACGDDKGSKRSRNNDNNTTGDRGGPPSGGGGDLSDLDLDEDDLSKLRPDGENLIVRDPRDGADTGIIRDHGRRIIVDDGSAIGGEFRSTQPVEGAYIVADNYTSAGRVSTDSISPTTIVDYGPSRVVAPDPTYVHIKPQDRLDAILTGGYDPNPDTGVAEFVYTDFQDDLIMYNLRTIALSFGEYRGQSMDLGPSLRELKVEPQPDPNQIVLMVKIQANGVYGGQQLQNGESVYRIEFEGRKSANGRRITLRQISRPSDDGGYRFQAYVTCMDFEANSCDTAIVVVEQISEHNEICKRGIAVYRDIKARLEMPDDLYTQVNCGQFPDQYPAAKRFLSYMANTVHSYRVRTNLDVPAQCTPTGSQYKIPHMEDTRARSWSAANGHAFVHIEGIESDYDYTSPQAFRRSDGTNPAAHLFDTARDWFRFWGHLKRDSEDTPQIFRHELRHYGDFMPAEPHIPQDQMVSGMSAPMAAEISNAVLEGNDGRGHLSLYLTFVDGFQTEIEFLGVSKRYRSPEGMRFYPFQGRQPQPITQIPVPFPEDDFKGM